MSEELTTTVNKLVELTKQIGDARRDIKVLTDAEKALKTQVKRLMEQTKIDVINLRDKGKISLKKTSRKATMSKKSVTEGLTNFFHQDAEKVEACLKAIGDCCATKESTSLSLTGIKDTGKVKS